MRDFNNNANIHNHKLSYDEFLEIWNKYITEKRELTSKENELKWSTTHKAIEKLMEELSIKKSLDHEFIDNTLPGYINDPLFDDEKYEEVEGVIRYLSILDNLIVRVNSNI